MGSDATGLAEERANQLAALWSSEADRLRGLAYLLLGDRSSAEDVVSDAFASVADRLDQLDSPAAYLRVVVVNGARRYQRRATTRPLWERVDGWATIIDTAETVAMRACLRALSADQREAVVLRYWGDLSLDEIADIMNCPPGTVASHLHRGLARLRTALKDQP